MYGLIKYLYFVAHYSQRQVALITKADPSIVSRVLNGALGKKAQPSLSAMDDEMLLRKQLLDRILSLEDVFVMQGDLVGPYIALLHYLGYRNDELYQLFPHISTKYIKHNEHIKSWQSIDATLFDCSEEFFKDFLQF